MTTKDIALAQITLISKSGEVLVGFSDNEALYNIMAEIVPFEFKGKMKES